MTISSSFANGTDGWTVEGGGSAPIFVADGAGGGYIQSSDTASDTFFFSAPTRFLGNRLGYFGGILSFDLRASSGPEWNEPQDIILTNGAGKSIFVTLPVRPSSTDFSHYSYALDASGGWTLASGAAASAADIREVLADLVNMRIVADLITGLDTTSLDNVTMQGSAPVLRFEGDPSGANPGAAFAHASLAEALGAAAAGQWIVVNDPTSPGGLHTVTMDNLHIAAPAGYAAQFFLAAGVATLSLGGQASFQVAGNAAANVLTSNAAGSALSGNGGNDTLRGGIGADSLDGGEGRDIVVGGGGNDRLNGGTDNDKLTGDNGNDTLIGGGGNDQLSGGNGRDNLSGGAGSDLFVFKSVVESRGANSDRIVDFRVDPTVGAAFIDRIDVRDIDAMTAATGNQAFTFIGTAAFTAEGQIRVEQRGADTLVTFNTSGNSGAEMQLSLLGFTASTLTFADFLL